VGGERRGRKGRRNPGGRRDETTRDRHGESVGSLPRSFPGNSSLTGSDLDFLGSEFSTVLGQRSVYTIMGLFLLVYPFITGLSCLLFLLFSFRCDVKIVVFQEKK